MPHASQLLHADNLSLMRGGRMVFAALHVSLAFGEIICVTGANGVGKSSLLKGLAGFLPFETGKVTHEAFHYLGHENGIKPALTLYENLAFWRDFYEGEGNITQALHAFGLENLAYLPTRLLSQGQKRRLALAKLLVAERPLWLLDEPQAGLDTKAKAQLDAVLAAHMAKGGGVLMATHEAINLPAKILTLRDEI